MKKLLTSAWQKIEDVLFDGNMIITAISCLIFAIAVTITVI